jgi:fatty acid desaturase
MYSEKRGIMIASAIAVLAIFAVGAGSVTGNFGGVSGGGGSATNVLFGIALIAVFLVAAVAVLKTLVPEGGFHQ